MHYTGQQAVNAANERANEDILPTCSSFLGGALMAFHPLRAGWLCTRGPLSKLSPTENGGGERN